MKASQDTETNEIKQIKKRQGALTGTFYLRGTQIMNIYILKSLKSDLLTTNLNLATELKSTHEIDPVFSSNSRTEKIAYTQNNAKQCPRVTSAVLWVDNKHC